MNDYSLGSSFKDLIGGEPKFRLVSDVWDPRRNSWNIIRRSLFSNLLNSMIENDGRVWLWEKE